jgi:polysaccharide biosynthesis transport protein
VIQTTVNPVHNQSSDNDQGYGQLLAVLIRRFPWFLAVFLSSIAVAAFMTKNTPPTYKSSMQLLVEPNYRAKTEGNGNNSENQFTDPSTQVDTATQLNLMRNTEHVEKAVQELKSKYNDYKDINAGQIKRSIVLSQIKEKEDNVATKIFQVEYADLDPLKTQRVLQALQRVYIDYNQEQQKERLRKGLKVINEQLDKVRKDRAESEASLLRFRKTQNLTDPETEVKNLEQTLAGIEQERRTIRSQYQEALARYNSLQERLKRNPQTAILSARLSQSVRYQSLLNEIQKTDLELEKQRATFTDEAESVKKLLYQREQQLKLLQQEASTTLGQNAGVLDPNAPLREQGNDSQIDLNLASQLVESETSIKGFSARDQSLAGKEQQVRDQLKRFPALLAEYNRLQPLVKLNSQRFEDLSKSEQQLRQELDKGGFDWKVVEKPQEGSFMGPNMQQNLMLGGVVGLILGGITAALREASDDSVHTTAELEKQAALPLLGTTPKLPPAREKDSIIKLPFGKPEVLSPWTVQVLQSPPRWESLDLIYKNIELLNSVAMLKSLMVTSPLADEGKSALALGLAMSAARLHKRVLLIDANLREPSLHKQLNLPNEQGLSTLLVSDTPLPEQISVQSLGSSYIDILTAGPEPLDPANLLSSPRMEQLMAAFEGNYDLVLIDAPPVLGLVDALLTGSACRSVVMVASIGKVTRTQITQATTMLNKLNLIGVVANGVSNSNSAYIPYIQQNRLALQESIEK